MNNLTPRKLTLTVAIAAYNAEKNIKRLTQAMLKQHTNTFRLRQVIVNSDSSTDQTIKNANLVKDLRLKVIDSRTRTGFAGTLINLINSNITDVILILNDDIIVTDKRFLEKAIQPFIKESNIGLVCCNAQPMKPESFVENAVLSGYIPYKKVSETTRNGRNVFTVDGKALAFSKEFLNNVTFPKDYRLMANVDKFMYFSCIKSKFKYRYVKEAIMYFKCPSSIKDFTNWQIRNFKSNKYLVKKTWGKLVDKEYKVIPSTKFKYYKLIELLKNPLGSTLIFALGIYCSYKAKVENKNFDSKWELVQTTKDL